MKQKKPRESSATTDELARRAPAADAPLSDLQNWMVEVLRHPRGLYKSEEMARQAAKHFCGNERVSPVKQVDIYRRQFWLRHTSILIDHFPGLCHVLGQKKWEPIAESYMREYGRSVFSLSDLGSHMAEHLRNQEPFLQQELCVDMARLEWAYQQSFAAPDDAPLSQEKVASIPSASWPMATLSVSQSLILLRLRYPVATLRRTIRKRPDQVDLEQALEQKGEQFLVVYRRERTLWDKAVSRPAFLLLEQLQGGKPLVPACEAVVRSCPEAEQVFNEELMTWFTLWGKLGWIVDVTVHEP